MNKVFTTVIYSKADWKNHVYIIDWDKSDWCWYDGPSELCKGEASKQEQSAADTQRAQENAIAQGQLAMQQAQLASVNAAVDPVIGSIMAGATPGVLQGVQEALTSQYMNQIPQQFAAIAGGINRNLVGRGISGGQGGAGSGDIARQFGQLGAMQAGLQQQGATNTALTMNNLKMGLLQNDLGLKMGIANQYGNNFGNANSGALGALNAGVTAANNVDQAQTSWMGPVFGGITGLAGKTTFTPGSGFGFGCWIAREIYGEESPLAEFARVRLWQRAQSEWTFRVITAIYAKVGQKVAELVKKSSMLRRMFRSLFDAFINGELEKRFPALKES